MKKNFANRQFMANLKPNLDKPVFKGEEDWSADGIL